LNKVKLAVAAGLCVSSVSAPSTHALAQEANGNQPTTQRLEDLIPDEALDNADGWALQGTAAEQAQPLPPEQLPQISDPKGDDSPFAQARTPLDIEAALEQLDIPVPAELEADPELQTAQIDAPDLIELPDLAETELSDELALAFPIDAEQFPEKAEFIERFRALSTILALNSDDATVPQLAARARADQQLLAEMLQAYGYYDGEVVRQLSGGRRDQSRLGSPLDSDPRVRFDILPGNRYAFGAIDLGALSEAPDYERLRHAFQIKNGDPLYSDRIIEREGALRIALGETGYPFATIAAPQLLIDHARDEGDLTLTVDPKGKYVFSEIISADPSFLSGKHLGRIARFEAGDTYQASLEADLRRAILATGLVSSATITTREIMPPSGSEPGKVALEVDVERAPLRTIAGAIGYGTEDGFKVEASWEHRNLFPPEGSLRLRGIFGTREQLASITYKRNNFRDRDQVLAIDAYASDIETEAVEARTIALRGSFERVSNLLFQKPFSWQVGAEALYTDERNRVIGGIARPRQTYTIFGLFGSATLDSSDNLLDPTEGFRVTAFAAPEVSHAFGTDTFYVRAQGDASAYQTLGSSVVAGRIRWATIQGAEAFEIAPSRRLYAGGGGSVRGYGYQAIGPRNDLGEPTGGASLVELAVEARIPTGLFDGALEIVPFVDAGSVSISSTPDFDEIKVGAGLGLRYKTSFGPIRVDVGTPLNPGEFDSPVVVYVSLGQAF
jgi:translocation and assembly module TamA